jgi:hypothetical protein
MNVTASAAISSTVCGTDPLEAPTPRLSTVITCRWAAMSSITRGSQSSSIAPRSPRGPSSPLLRRARRAVDTARDPRVAAGPEALQAPARRAARHREQPTVRAAQGAAGTVRRSTLPAPASVAVYGLTAAGERLRELLVALGLWGLDLPVDERVDPSTARAELVALCLAGTQDRAGWTLLAARRSSSWSARRCSTCSCGRAGSCPRPTRPSDSPATSRRSPPLALHTLTPPQALEDGRAETRAGSPTAFTDVFDLLGTPGHRRARCTRPSGW